MDEETFKKRTRQLAVDVIRVVEGLPHCRSADVISRQLLRSITSVGANYRASCRSRSMEEFISKLGIVEEEADESLYWMELLLECRITTAEQVSRLMRETTEILAMTVASRKTLKLRLGITDLPGRQRRPPRIGNRESGIVN